MQSKHDPTATCNIWKTWSWSLELGWLWALFQEKDLTNLQNGRKGPKKVPQRSHLSVGRGLIAIWAIEGDFYNGASLRWHWMILDDI